MSSLFQVIRSGMGTKTWRHVAPVLWAVTLMACSGQSCSGCGSGGGLMPIPGGYPVTQRLENAVQLRVAQPFFDFLSANLSLLAKLLPGGGAITVPADCGGNPQFWCGGGSCAATSSCNLALNPTALQFNTTGGELNVTLRTKIKISGAHVHYKSGIISVTCDVDYDTGASGKSDAGLVMGLQTKTDPMTRLTSINVDPGSVHIQDLEADDIDIGGSITCDIVGFFAGSLLSTIEKTLTGQLAGPLNAAFCQKCKTSDDCSSLATPAGMGCDMSKKVCMRNGSCMEFLGTEGKLDVGAALGALAPAAAGSSLEIYAAAGSYSAAETGGLSLGLLGGVVAPVAADCVPQRPAPTAMPPMKLPAFAGNAAPNGKPYAIGAGISTAELNQVGYGFYQSGGLCLSLGTAQVALLSSSTLSFLIRSLSDLTNNQSSSVQVVLRPQNPPVFTLGKGTFKTDMMGKKTIDDPLLTITLPGLAIDFYLFMNEHYVRLFRLSADVGVPLGIDVDGMGRLVPILGDLSQALAHITVTDTVLLKETPAQLAAIFPSLLPALLGQIGGAIKPIALPSIMGINLAPVQIASVADGANPPSLLGLFLGVSLAGQSVVSGEGLAAQAVQVPSVETSVQLMKLEVPPLSRFALGPLHDPAHGPRATIEVQAQGPAGSPTEWQYAVDDGLWRPFDDRAQVVVDDAGLGLAGEHHIDVRARVVGEPSSLDPSPARVTFTVMPLDDRADVAGVPAGVAGTGCSVQPGRAAGSPVWALLGLPLVAGVLLRRRLRRAALVVGAGALVAAGQGACSSDTTMTTMGGSGFAKTDEIGKYQSAAVQGSAVYISAYDATWGDLAYAKVTDTTMPIQWSVVDGLPAGMPDSTMDGAPRMGFTAAGPDVGRFTSLAVQKGGSPVIAFQDVTGGRARVAVGTAKTWTISSIDEPPGGSVARLGLFNSMVLDGSDVPTVAYMTSGVPKGDGSVQSQLVVATAHGASPMGPGDWTRKVVDSVPTACVGLCPMGQVCTYSDPAKADPTVTLCKATAGGCAMPCAKGTACVSGACVDDLSASAALSLPEGTGLFARLVQGPSGLQVFWYNQVKKQLMTASGPDWAMVKVIDGDGKGDVGQYVDAVVAADGTVHVVYQDAVSNQLLYKSVVMGVPEAKAEVVDDGIRGAGDAKELDYVGAGAQVFLDGMTVRVVYQNQTTETMELASKAMGAMAFTHMTQMSSAAKGVGFYPQVVQFNSKWVVLDVAYDRATQPPLSSVEFAPL